MAMLMMNSIFGKTWGGRCGQEPSEEFWPFVIAALRNRHPETLLLAEAYWDLEWELQHQGFDFCYDKRLYDRVVEQDVAGLRGHLHADLAYQSGLVRFLENHDEPRIASRVSPDVERAAAVTVATLPGAVLWHEGQFEGRRVRPPVFLRRRPEEEADDDLAGWYRRLLAVVAADEVRRGTWELCEVVGWDDNQSCQNLLAWRWYDERVRHLVVVNLSGSPAQGRVPLPWPDLHGRSTRLRDLLTGAELERDGDEALDPGLYVALEPWQAHLLALD
jgi:hypothetical protein